MTRDLVGIWVGEEKKPGKMTSFSPIRALVLPSY